MIGIDLAVRRPSSLAGLTGEGIWLWRSEAKELLENKLLADVVVIDAPLSLPKAGGFRDFERKLISKGYRLLPINMRYMRELAMLGMELRRKFENSGSIVLETHPSSAIKALGESREGLVHTLSRFGFHPGAPKSKDDIDALICLLAGILYRKGEVDVLGEDTIFVLPKMDTDIRVLLTREPF